MKITIDKDKIQLEENEKVNSGSLDYYILDLEFDETWNDLTKKAILLKDGEDEGIEIAVINNQIYLNIEENGKYYVGLVGYAIEENEEDEEEIKKIYQISTNLLPILINKGAGEIEVVEGEIPTISQWEIYIKQIEDLCDGVVISEITEEIEGLNHNFTIEYTNGSTFEFTIKDGAKGEKGNTGEAGYTPIKGIDYFDGAKGDKGDRGSDGYTPVKGVDYFDGKDGKDGKDGTNRN